MHLYFRTRGGRVWHISTGHGIAPHSLAYCGKLPWREEWTEQAGDKPVCPRCAKLEAKSRGSGRENELL